MAPSKMDQDKKPNGKDWGLERKVAFASGLFQADVTVRTVLECLVEGIVVIDNKGSILLLNQAAETMFGYPTSELVGKPHVMLFPERFRKEHTLPDLADQFPDLTGLRKDGSEFPIEFRVGYLKTLYGDLILALFSDITQRREAQNNLRKRDELFHLQIERVRDYAIFTLDADGMVLNWNTGAERLKGYRAEEIIGRHFSNFYTEEDRKAGKPAQKLKEAVAEGQTSDEGWRVRKDGSMFWADVVITALYDDNGKLRGFSKVTHDITQRKNAEEALRASEVRYRGLFEYNMDAIFLTTAGGKITAANAAACVIFGMSEQELCEAGSDGIFDHNDPRLAGIIAERDRSGTFFGELNFVRKDGSTFPAEISSVISPDGRLGFVFLRDITERKKNENSLRMYAQRLIAMEKDLRKKIADDLHDDIGQITVAIQLDLHQAAKCLPRDAAPKCRELFQEAMTLIKEMSNTIRTLITELHPISIEILGLPAAVRCYLDHYVPRTGLKVFFDADPDFPRIFADIEIALYRIIQEALTNVAKHAAATKVFISLRKAEGIRLTIADDGKGFSPKEIAPTENGRGWGLMIMQERAKLVGGTFQLSTSPGQGTSIMVEIREVAEV